MLKKNLSNSGCISLIPMTSIQFYDVAIDSNQMVRNAGFFVGRRVEKDNQEKILLYEILYNEEKGFYYDSGDNKEIPGDSLDEKKFKVAVENFKGQWLPLPFFTQNKSGNFQAGPTNWVRGRIVEVADQGAQIGDYRLVLAFDTSLSKEADRNYTTPTESDLRTGGADSPTMYRLHDGEHLCKFVEQNWVGAWIEECFERGQEAKAQQSRSTSQTKEERAIEARISYVCLIRFLASKKRSGNKGPWLPQAYFVQTVSRQIRSEPRDVSLILDIGHSRTCGFLLEDERQNGTLRGNKLELRDLTDAEHVYTEPFDSQLEFSVADFGDKRLSNKSGRRKNPRLRRNEAFAWPSVCRVGTEARSLSYQGASASGPTGFLNPKKFLWDEKRYRLAWHFCSKTAPRIRKVSTSDFGAELDGEGRWLKGEERKDDAVPGFSSQYSRSSMMMFFIAEIIMQAISQINSVNYREGVGHPSIPRVLKNIILTVPSAMPANEVKALEARARDAIGIIWKLMGWNENPDEETSGLSPAMPNLFAQWDEPTCTQATYLYAEIAEKFHGRAKDFLELFGKPRVGPGESEEAPSIRIASLDIGGGTTDLAITTFWMTGVNTPLAVDFNFREGFSFGGGEILKLVIEKAVFPALIYAIRQRGTDAALERYQSLFTVGRVDDSIAQQVGRRAFATQIAQEIALQALKMHEKEPDAAPETIRWLELSDVFESSKRPSEAALRHYSMMLKVGGLKPEDGFRLALPIEMHEVANAVYEGLQRAISNLSEVIHKFNCDVLLVSGAPSRLPALKRLIRNFIPVALNRIEFMHGYRDGGWYPYRDEYQRLDDPKTTVVVGAAILHLARGSLESLSLDVKAFRLGNLIRHIGVMDKLLAIDDEKLIFKNLSPKKADSFPQNATVLTSKPMMIGYQQIRLRRWPTTPFYSFGFTDVGAGELLTKGVNVEFELNISTSGGPRRDEEEENEIPIGLDLSIVDADAVDESVSHAQKYLELTPRSITRDQEDEGWQENGVFSLEMNPNFETLEYPEPEQAENG